jgi:preprotein translocase subunit SecD
MGNNLGTKLAIIIAVLLFFIYGIIGPHTAGSSLKDSPKAELARNINLGLDLKGGTHLVLQVHVADAINSETDREVGRIDTAFQGAGIMGPTVTKPDPANTPGVIAISGVTPAQMAQVRSLLGDNDYANYDLASGADAGSLKLTMKQAAVNDLEKRTMDTSIEVIRDRIDVLGTKEPLIQPYGGGANQILVEVPGLDDPDKVYTAINSASKLAVFQVLQGPWSSDQEALQALNGQIPPDGVLVHGNGTPASPDQVYLLKRESVVEGTDFRDAQPGTDINGRPNIRFTLTTDAGNRFYKFTDEHKEGGPDAAAMAIVSGDKIREVANIQSAIRDQGEITGSFSEQEVAAISLVLRTGSLPATITPLETRTVGPSLGALSIRQGTEAAIAGMAAVMIFMLVYYKGSGINADLALVLNLIILLGYMGWTGAVLTLPGIAGVILTVGMGVDSNVLIFERIREELRAGKTAASAVKEGFGHAWTTIVDTHVTTIVSALILYFAGSGPVKGFAVTLMAGLVANLITAVFVSRMIFDWHLQDRPKTAALSI